MRGKYGCESSRKSKAGSGALPLSRRVSDPPPRAGGTADANRAFSLVSPSVARHAVPRRRVLVLYVLGMPLFELLKIENSKDDESLLVDKVVCFLGAARKKMVFERSSVLYVAGVCRRSVDPA